MVRTHFIIHELLPQPVANGKADKADQYHPYRQDNDGNDKCMVGVLTTGVGVGHVDLPVGVFFVVRRIDRVKFYGTSGTGLVGRGRGYRVAGKH